MLHHSGIWFQTMASDTKKNSEGFHGLTSIHEGNDRQLRHCQNSQSESVYLSAFGTKATTKEHNSSNFNFQGYHVDIYQYMWDLEELLEMSSSTFHIHNTSWVLLLHVKSKFLCNQRRRIIASQYNIDTVSMKNLTSSLLLSSFNNRNVKHTKIYQGLISWNIHELT